MYDEGIIVFTDKGNEQYIIYGDSGDFLLLGVQYPCEECPIEECKLFKTKEEMEKYIDENPIKYERYACTWINLHQQHN